jgi:transcriptional regulator with XRE-family HTH domain
MAFDLSGLRRRYGLSQTQLADLMGIAQSTVSRWERGVESIKPSTRLELLDLFSNRNGKLDPVVKQWISQRSAFSVFDFRFNCLSVHKLITELSQREESEFVGNNYADMADTEWQSHVYGDVPIEERVSIEFEHNLVSSTLPGGKVLPIRTRQHYIQFEDSGGIVLNQVELIAPCESVQVISCVTTQSLEFPQIDQSIDDLVPSRQDQCAP